MLPDCPTISRCTEFGPIFWVSSATVLGEIPWGSEASAPDSWRHAPEVRQLTADEYLLAIAQGMADTTDRLFDLRRRAWWAANHAGRQKPATTPAFPAGSAARANLESLLALFDENQAEHLLMKADALRELGRFDEAAQVLVNEKLREPRLEPWVRPIKKAIVRGDARVVELGS